jgi:hypothetical protein
MVHHAGRKYPHHCGEQRWQEPGRKEPQVEMPAGFTICSTTFESITGALIQHSIDKPNYGNYVDDFHYLALNLPCASHWPAC